MDVDLSKVTTPAGASELSLWIYIDIASIHYKLPLISDDLPTRRGCVIARRDPAKRLVLSCFDCEYCIWQQGNGFQNVEKSSVLDAITCM